MNSVTKQDTVAGYGFDKTVSGYDVGYDADTISNNLLKSLNNNPIFGDTISDTVPPIRRIDTNPSFYRGPQLQEGNYGSYNL
jgi:hypothetical protein